jgi:hypothetical protein
MSFKQLIAKVKQAEDALEAHERSVAADLRQLKRSWRDAWTPGRIVIAGLLGGFFVGSAEPMRSFGKGSGGLMQMVSMLSGLLAGGSAQVAAGQAEQAAGSARQAAAVADPDAEALARAEVEMQAARAAATEPIEP